MNALKTKSLEGIEEKMQNIDKDSLRYHVLESAKNFKTSWIELGRSLYSVWKDKLYKEWGYSSFDIYTAKEIGIRKITALKLLRSYCFLEKEEPEYLKVGHAESAAAASLPSYESVDVLRLAKNKKFLDKDDYENLKKGIFEKGKDACDARKELTALIRERQDSQPEDAFEKKRASAVRRLLGTLKTLKKEIEISKLLPASLIKETASLINKIEAEIE